MDLLSIPKHLEVNHKPQLELAAAQIEAWGKKPNTSKLKTLVASIRIIGVDTGCLDETLQEYIDTPSSENEERVRLLDRLQCNIYTIIEDYEADWLEFYDKSPKSATAHPLYAKWREFYDRVAETNSNPRNRDSEQLFALHFIELGEGRWITFDSNAKNTVGWFSDLSATIEEGSIALIVTSEQYNTIHRILGKKKNCCVWAITAQGEHKCYV